MQFNKVLKSQMSNKRITDDGKLTVDIYRIREQRKLKPENSK